MTAKQLAALIHKSTSAVSKYENGEVAIDILTLSEIADVLDVSITQLTDYMDEKASVNISAKMPYGFFSKGSMFFIYYINGKQQLISKSILEFHADSSTVLLYDNLVDYSNKYDCRHLYHGSISFSDTYINMVMQNQTAATEKLYLVIRNPFTQQDHTFGIISGISSRNMMPITFKFLISRHPLRENEELAEKLILTKKELKDIKSYNNFSIDLSTE